MDRWKADKTGEVLSEVRGSAGSETCRLVSTNSALGLLFFGSAAARDWNDSEAGWSHPQGACCHSDCQPVLFDALLDIIFVCVFVYLV